MYAYRRALVIVLTIMALPEAEAACVLKDGSAAAEAAPAADRCTAPEPADGRVPAWQRDEIMQWIAERLDRPQAEDRPAIMLDVPAGLEHVRNGGLGNRPAPTPP